MLKRGGTAEAFRPLGRGSFSYIAVEMEENTMAYRALKGTKDVLPGEAHLWHHLEDTMRAVKMCIRDR